MRARPAGSLGGPLLHPRTKRETWIEGCPCDWCAFHRRCKAVSDEADRRSLARLVDKGMALEIVQ